MIVEKTRSSTQDTIRGFHNGEMIVANYRCKTCKQSKAEEEFGRTSADRRHLHCKDCRRAKARRKKYNLSVAEQIERLRIQGGRCILCQAPITLRTMHIDHDHNTGKVRGFLCRTCNHYLHAVEALGKRWVQRALQYLVGRYD